MGVVGAGLMGSGIAETAARAGIAVTIYEPDEGPLASSRERIEVSLSRAVEGAKATTEEAKAAVQRIDWTTEIESVARCDFVIEAVVEDEGVKGALFQTLDALLPTPRPLASNTSSIPIAVLAAHTDHPDRVLGVHFFSPVPVMQLVEIVVGLDTTPETVARAEGLAAQIGKTAIQTKDRSGFVVNFLLVPYLVAAVRMYAEGFASREDIDTGMRLGCGHPMGPLALSDMVGLDVLFSVCNSLYDEFKREEYAPPPLLKRMVASGHLGRKSGRGFYSYDVAG
jgi:3-hydroxybutyryl-CoA dehydrogenase